MNGRRVVTVIDGEHLEAGAHELSFDAANLVSGVYAYRLEAGHHREMRLLVHVR